MAHNTKIEYKSEYLQGVELPEGWTVGRHDEGTYWASGPCVACGGDAYGPALPEGLGGADRHVDEVVGSVRADCRCGDSHGQEGAKGCGRYWVVEVQAKAGGR